MKRMHVMRTLAMILLAAAALVQSPVQSLAQNAEPPAGPQYQAVGNMSQLMISIIYPASDAIFYVERDPPKTEKNWNDLQAQALMLAESGNLIMMPGRKWGGEEWMKDSKVLVDVGAAAYKAAKAKDLDALVALNGDLYNACVVCHEKFRPNYGKRQRAPSAGQGKQ